MNKKLRLLSLAASFLSLAFSLLFSSSSSASKQVLDPIRKDETSLKLNALCNPEENPYFDSIDGEQVGIIPELTALLGKSLNATINIINIDSYSGYLQHLKAGDFDLLLDASSLTSAAYLTNYDLSSAYYTISYSKVTLKNSTTTSKKVATLGKESMSGTYARSFYYEEQISEFETIDECLGAVKDGSCYSAVINTLYAEAISNADVRSIFAVSKLSDDALSGRIAVKNDG